VREGEGTYEALQISRRQRTAGVGEQCMPGDQVWDECQTRVPKLAVKSVGLTLSLGCTEIWV